MPHFKFDPFEASLFRTLENMVNKCICFDLQLILVVSSLH